jgi:hypothetical protein
MPGWFSSRAFLLLATTQQKARCFSENFRPLPLRLSWPFLASLRCSFDFSLNCFAEKRRIPFCLDYRPEKQRPR